MIVQFDKINGEIIQIKLLKMQQSNSENPQLMMELSLNSTYSSMVRKTQRLSIKANLFEQCKNILKKPFQHRNPSQNQILLKMIERSEFIKDMHDYVGLQFVKGILKNAKIEVVDERQVIVKEDQPLQYMVVILQGKLAVQKRNFCILPSSKNTTKQTIDIQMLRNDDLFEKLTKMAKKQRDLFKKQSKLQRKSSFPISQYQFLPPVLANSDYQQALTNIQRVVNVNQQFGAHQRLSSTNYQSRVFALEKTTLLIIQIGFLFYWLEVAYKSKLVKNIEFMKKIPCFDFIEEEKLSQIILSMKFCKKKKNDIIYQQDTNSQMIYILVEGEIKLVKNASLFKQNPNNFYVDRRKLMQQIHKEQKLSKTRSLKKDEEVLPFANLTTLYNYRPVKKAIEIGIVSSFGLFGEEQVIYKTKRQTTAIVNCLETIYYQIQLKKILEIIGPKCTDRFRQILQHSINKKVLYRQNQFADHIQFQNKVNLDYFYLEGTKQKQSPRKFKLEKINERIAPHTARDESNNVPAYYTSFNFNKMFNNKRYSQQLKKQTKKTKKTTQESSSDTIVTSPYNPHEQRIVGISHSWNPIQKKVKQQKSLSRKISPFKHEINIEAPLIDQQFFRDVAKEHRRINKQFRTVRFSLGKKLK